jgi:hypothetical protein
MKDEEVLLRNSGNNIRVTLYLSVCPSINSNYKYKYFKQKYTEFRKTSYQLRPSQLVFIKQYQHGRPGKLQGDNTTGVTYDASVNH